MTHSQGKSKRLFRIIDGVKRRRRENHGDGRKDIQSDNRHEWNVIYGEESK